MEQEVIISTTALSKRIGPKPILNNVNLRIKRGDTVFIKGSDVLAETALFRIISLVDNPGSGRIVLFGEEIHNTITPLMAMRLDALKRDIASEGDAEQKQLLRREYTEVKLAYKKQSAREKKLKAEFAANTGWQNRIVVVDNNFNLYPHLTVIENMALPFNLGKQKKLLPDAQFERNARAILSAYHLSDLADLYPNSLTEIEALQIAILGALAKSPLVLILNNLRCKRSMDNADLVDFIYAVSQDVETMIVAGDLLPKEFFNTFYNID